MGTSFSPSGPIGELVRIRAFSIGYTVKGGVLALIALGLHGALYLAVKQKECSLTRFKGLARAIGHTLIGLPATVIARPNSLENYRGHPFLFMVPVAVIASIAIVAAATRRHSAFIGFLASCSFLTTMLAGAAAGFFQCCYLLWVMKAAIARFPLPWPVHTRSG